MSLSGDSWIATLTAVKNDGTGAIVQLFPQYCPTGVNPFANHSAGSQIRRPVEGELLNVQIQSDGTNGGVIEMWDINGLDGGIDVSSATAITAAQLASLISRGLARLIYTQNFAGASGATNPTIVGKVFARGLAARFSNSGPTGSCTLNLTVKGGYELVDSAGKP